ncbi:MAG TPA: hypothetical protein VMM12_09475 [Longimicrobiales bacterium]|nr:hypothetical protein [Longimicrobiales bacterium]
MLAHVLAVLGLAFYGFEVYRTVRRFGVRRAGMFGAAAGAPRAHVFMAVLMTVIFFILAASFAAVPFYVAPAGAVINAVYLVLALRYARRRSAERRARLDRG